MMRSVGVDADAVDDSIHANARREALERLHRIFLLEVNGFSSLLLRHLQTISDSVDGKNPAGVQQFSAGDGELPNRSAAKHSYGASGVNVCELGCHVAGGK